MVAERTGGPGLSHSHHHPMLERVRGDTPRTINHRVKQE